jgi:NitT/TauT family transport system substrate-binding protein
VNAGLSVLGVSDLQSSLDDQPLKEFFVLPDSDIESVKDLKGKRIAINAFGGSFYYSWIIELEKQGLKESDVTFVSLPFPEQITALENDQVDVVSLMVPHNSIAKQRGLRLLMDANDIFKSKQFSLHFINSEWGKDNPEIAERFVKSIAEAIRFIYENPVTSKSIISKYTGISVDLIPDYKFQKFGMVIEEDVVFWLNFMKDRTDITINPLLKYQDIATNKYNPFADRGEK